ncbi:MAG: nonstructural protein [Arizlama microvirus]|nr:MAG: nonstructural protein [Arizlama microvirus]QXP08386.1 MAG: nonstructural protein [Arizlama microvirus]
MKNLYSIFDKQTMQYGNPWIAENDNTAKRAFERLASDKNTDVSFRPSDFELYAVGYFDEESGLFQSQIAKITPPLAS